MKYLEKIVSQTEKMGITLQPCDAQEVVKIMNFANGFLPAAYVEFLQLMGKGTSPGFLRGHSCFFNEIFDLKEGAEQLLNENNFKEKLSDHDFVFWMSQGYQFAFFKTTEGADPAIYYYREGSGQNHFWIIQKHFSDFLLNFLNHDAELFQEKF